MFYLKKCNFFFVLVFLLTSNEKIASKEINFPKNFFLEFKKRGIHEDSIAIDIRSINGNININHNNERSLKPASLMKLVTTIAGLDLLGPNYRWKTNIYTNGYQRKNTLYGDLIIKGSGDPRFAHEDLWILLRQLRSLGIKKIKGNLILDRSLFKKKPHNLGFFDNKTFRAYNVLPDALLLDAKAIHIKIKPNYVKKNINISILPPIKNFIKSSIKTSLTKCGDWKKKLKYEFKKKSINIYGNFSIYCGEKTLILNPINLDHLNYFNLVFRQIWSELGGTITGPMIEKSNLKGIKKLTFWSSSSLAEIIRDINKFSNNVMSRQLSLTICSEKKRRPIDEFTCTEVIKNWLREVGIHSNTFVIENGSGLSNKERISASVIAELLDYAWKSPTMPEFFSSLPIAGIDGTIRKRFNNSNIRGKAHIKTGSLKDVLSMAGLLKAKSGQRLIFVFIINGSNAPKFKNKLDKLLEWIYEKY